MYSEQPQTVDILPPNDRTQNNNNPETPGVVDCYFSAPAGKLMAKLCKLSNSVSKFSITIFSSFFVSGSLNSRTIWQKVLKFVTVFDSFSPSFMDKPQVTPVAQSYTSLSHMHTF